MKKKYENICKDYLREYIESCNDKSKTQTDYNKTRCDIVYKMLDDCIIFKERKTRKNTMNI